MIDRFTNKYKIGIGSNLTIKIKFDMILGSIRFKTIFRTKLYHGLSQRACWSGAGDVSIATEIKYQKVAFAESNVYGWGGPDSAFARDVMPLWIVVSCDRWRERESKLSH